MLGKIETAYLGLLRVIVLIAATLALIVAAWGLVSAVPPLLRWAGLTETTKPNGGTLKDFIDEQRITETVARTEVDDITQQVLPDLAEAAKTIRSYLGKRGTVSEKLWGEHLQDYADQLPAEAVTYAASARELATQLPTSRGKPLSEARVNELMQWHFDRFKADLEVRSTAEAEGNAKFWMTIASAGISFVAFVLIIFIFLFVKIERSLRLVRVVHLATAAVEPEDA